MTAEDVSLEPSNPFALPRPEPTIVAEWDAAMKRGRERSRKQALRELIEIGAGVTVFFIAAIGGLVLTTKLFSMFVTREMERVSLADNARSLTILLLGPVLLLVLPFILAAFVIRTLRKKRP